MNKLILIFSLALISGLAHATDFTVNEDQMFISNIPTSFHDEDQANWAVIEDKLVNTQYSKYTLEWKGTGGKIYLGYKMAMAIEKAKKQGKFVVLDIIGEAESVHANVACHASQLLFHLNNHSHLLFHRMALADSGGYGVSRATDDARYDWDTCVAQRYVASYVFDNIFKTSTGQEVVVQYFGGQVKYSYAPDRRVLKLKVSNYTSNTASFDLK